MSSRWNSPSGTLQPAVITWTVIQSLLSVPERSPLLADSLPHSHEQQKPIFQRTLPVYPFLFPQFRSLYNRFRPSTKTFPSFMVSAAISRIWGHPSGKLIGNENLAVKLQNPSSHSQELQWPSSLLGDSSSPHKAQAVTEVLLVRSAGRKPQSTINLLHRCKQQSIDQTVSLPVSHSHSVLLQPPVSFLSIVLWTPLCFSMVLPPLWNGVHRLLM